MRPCIHTFHARHGRRIRILVDVGLVWGSYSGGGRATLALDGFRFWYEEVLSVRHATTAGCGYFGFGNLHLAGVRLHRLNFARVVWVVLRLGVGVLVRWWYGTVPHQVARFHVLGNSQGGGFVVIARAELALA